MPAPPPVRPAPPGYFLESASPPVVGSDPGTLDCATLDPAVVGEVELPGNVVTDEGVVDAVVVVVVPTVVVGWLQMSSPM